MNYNKKSVEDIDVKGKRVLCRCDFNVPIKGGVITSDKRIVAALPTIQYLINHGAKVILCSHMGKPKGEYKPELSLKVVADRLSGCWVRPSSWPRTWPVRTPRPRLPPCRTARSCSWRTPALKRARPRTIPS